MDKSFNDVKAVLFDFGGTLDADGLTWRQQFYPIYKKMGFDWTMKEFDPFFYFADDTLTERTLKTISFRKTIRMQVSLLLKKAGLYDRKIAGGVVTAYVKGSLASLKRNKPMLLRLKKKYKLGIISNFYGNLPVICREAGYHKIFDVIIDSGRAGVTKPDPGIFRLALKKLGLSPQEAAMVGDSLKRDMMGAKGLGMRHIRVLHNDAENRRTCCRGDRTIHSVRDLKGILL